MIFIPGCPCCSSGKCLQISAAGYTASGNRRALVDIADSLDGLVDFPVYRWRYGSSSTDNALGATTYSNSFSFDWQAVVAGTTVYLRAILELPTGYPGTATLTVWMKTSFFAWNVWWLYSPTGTAVYSKTISASPLGSGASPLTFSHSDQTSGTGTLGTDTGESWKIENCACKCTRGRYFIDYYYSGTCSSWWDVVDNEDGTWSWVKIGGDTCGGAGAPPEVSSRPTRRLPKPCVCDTGDTIQTIVETTPQCIWAVTLDTDSSSAKVAVHGDLTTPGGCINPLP